MLDVTAPLTPERSDLHKLWSWRRTLPRVRSVVAETVFLPENVPLKASSLLAYASALLLP